MKGLVLKRVCQCDSGTYGVLIDSEPFALTLEPALPIPPAVYECEVYASPRFKENVYILKDVPGYEYIEIHKGNTIKDTIGCILIGYRFGVVGESNGITHSGAAFYEFMNHRMKGEASFMLTIANP